MLEILQKILDYFKGEKPKSPEEIRKKEVEERIYAYNKIKEAVPSYNEPNYSLAEYVFRDFNDFNLKNNENLSMYTSYIPKSLLPYSKNYIKCAYYIFMELAKKNNDLKLFKLIQAVGCQLFYDYPDYDKYKENLKTRKTLEIALKDTNSREEFKKMYGAYEISEEDYNSSPNSIDSTDEKLIHDFGILPEIEKDIDWGEIKKNYKEKQA